MKLNSELILLLTFVVSFVENEDILDPEKIKVRFFDTIGHPDHDSSYVYGTSSMVEFICICQNCRTVELYTVSRNKSYKMDRRELSDNWILAMKVNEDNSLGQYQCRNESTTFATYNWLYRLAPCDEGCDDLYLCVYGYNETGKTEVCSDLEEDICNETHRFRPLKSVICSVNKDTNDIFAFNSLCKAIFFYRDSEDSDENTFPFTEIVDKNQTCEMLTRHRYSSHSSLLLPYMIRIPKNDDCSVLSADYVSLGDTVMVDNPALFLCYICIDNTLVYYWVNKEKMWEKHCQNDSIRIWHRFTLGESTKVKIYFETVSNNVTVSRTYAYFVYIEVRVEIVEKQIVCNKGSNVSSVLECSITSKLFPLDEFKIEYTWKTGHGVEIATSNVLLVNESRYYKCNVQVGVSGFDGDDLSGDFAKTRQVDGVCKQTSAEGLNQLTTSDNTEDKAMFLHIIIALVILICAIGIILVATFAVIRWKKKRELSYLTGETSLTTTTATVPTRIPKRVPTKK